MRSRRLRLGLLQREVAEIVGTTVHTIRNWEANRRTPQVRYLPAVNAFLKADAYCTQETSLGQRIVACGRAHGVSQRALARRLGIDQSTVVGWELGRHRPSSRLWERLTAEMPELDEESARPETEHPHLDQGR